MTSSYESVVYKFSGAGNDFVVLDGRNGGVDAFREAERIGELCRQYRTDGLMILTTPRQAPKDGQDVGAGQARDFQMEFYNPDGSGGMMCGNGGRCIVAFAHYMGIQPADGHIYHFQAPDGPHTAEILDHPCANPGENGINRPELCDQLSELGQKGAKSPEIMQGPEGALLKWTVRLKMIDVNGITPIMGGYFLNTGTRHFVQFVDKVDTLDMEAEAKPLRWDPAFQPEGTNVNFVEVRPDGLHVRTYEKGVEGETLACGTGLTASALAAWQYGVPPSVGAQRPGRAGESGPRSVEGSTLLQAVSYRLQCRRGDWLEVQFQPGSGDSFTDVYLTGPAELVAVK